MNTAVLEQIDITSMCYFCVLWPILQFLLSKLKKQNTLFLNPLDCQFTFNYFKLFIVFASFKAYIMFLEKIFVSIAE